MKKATALLLIALLFGVMIACTANEDPAQPSATPIATATPIPEDVIICTVNDKNIMRSDFVSPFITNYDYYASQADFSDEALLKSLQDLVFDNLLQGEILYQKALELNVSLSVQEEQALSQQIETEYNSYMDMYKATAQQQGVQDIEAQAEALFAADLARHELTPVQYKARMTTEARKALLSSKLYEQTTASITFTEVEAQQQFATDLAADRSNFSSMPSLYETAQSEFESGSGVPPLFIPEGFVRVKHILVADEQTALSLIERVNKGEDFDALMAEFGTDPGMQREPTMSTGYLMNKDTGFVEEFKAAALALQNVGDLTEPVKSTHGYHVIRLVEKLESRELTFDEIKDDYINTKLVAMRSDHFKAEVEKWQAAAQITSYVGRIRDVGKVS